MKNDFFNDLKQSLDEAVGHARGERHDLRVTTLPRPPQPMTKTEITALRRKMQCSQAVFARYLNVSVKTVQSWEQGHGKPSGAALKLLSVVKIRPEVVFTNN